ncbi:MAG: diguanylate cyclase [Mariprofundus sp.]
MKYLHGDPVLIIGAGPGGTALLDIFTEEPLIQLAGIVDTNMNAIGIQHAKARNIPVFVDLDQARRNLGRCIVFNMTGDEHISDIAARWVGSGSVIGGQEARLFWQIISRLQTARDELSENQSRLKAVIHNVCEGIVTIDTRGIIENINPAIEDIFGYTQDELIGQSIGTLMPESQQHTHASYLQHYIDAGEQSVFGHYREVTGLRQSGEEFPLEINVTEMTLSENKHFIGILRDITERKKAEDKMTQLALYDQLTKLPNRTLFYERMEFSLTQAKRTKSMMAVLFIDLDGFKAVNDTQGHDMGDHLLLEVGKRLSGCIRASDVVARMGGDEFTVILTNFHSLDKVSQIADNIITALNRPIIFKDNSCNVGASIGISVFPRHGDNIDDLVKVSDGAMYQAKNAGKNRHWIAP